MDNYIGEIRIFAGDYAPEGWAICDGALLPVAEHEALFALIGYSWGGADLSFALPDFRGRLPVGQGAGPGLGAKHVGQRDGSEEIKLEPAHLPSHTHPLYATAAEATTEMPGPDVVLAKPGLRAATSSSPSGLAYVTQTAGTVLVQLNEASLSEEGGSVVHDNLMPALAVNFIVALKGEFPVQA